MPHNIKHLKTMDDSVTVQKKGKVQDLSPRNAPVQGRSKLRSKQIIDVTGELLERVGFDDLNTILIAKEVGISIGSLYHYFPNKHAILYAMALRWLEGIETVLNEIDQWPVESLSVDELVDRMLAINLKVYKKQKAILTLVQAMFSVPALRELDNQHDDLVISRMAVLFKRMGIQRHLKERERLARIYLEMTHSIFLVVVNQKGDRAKRTLADLRMMVCTLLHHHLASKA
ncbi:TetR/AcrR family transcriptional regulator [Neptunomonas antarctica]|uniref:Transcriptional regulator, TetR family n=1 Tax=Neptunomonas antarctica TaxID=619304 RepID=A0A1N7JAK6_9GAMM|nr:TetR/AcrR family transcriptional regulator [Neptunomonas antarctica]SIS46402.1 transcriptional regulator, TetR family [Neptunomonas antarctica]